MSKKRTTKRKGDKIKIVNFDMVKQLLLYQKKRNRELRGKGYYCDLRPKDSEPCTSCRYYKQCYHFEWEREFIYKRESDNKLFQRRKSRKNRATEKEAIIELNFSLVPEYPFESFGFEYPCYPQDFDCPMKHICEEGQFCPWK